jgi:pimeloyl-ACP methyl ester carboxylesterase
MTDTPAPPAPPLKDRIVQDQPGEMPAEAGPLALFAGASPPAPDWFTMAVNSPYETQFVEVEGARLHVQRWGDPRLPGLLLVHGNGAHAHWWDFIAPYFSASYHVVALTFSGMGDSDWRERYDMAQFAREMLAVMETSGMFAAPEPPIVVAHSFGGFVTILAGAEYGERLGGTVIVDSPVNPPKRHEVGAPRTDRRNKVYPSLERALARFRLAPPQPCENLFALDYIARWSLKRASHPETGEDGWTWKFDPSIWRRFELGRSAADCLAATRCRIAVFRGEESALMPEHTLAYMQQLLGHEAAFVSIPHARHHVMLDQPLAFVAALRTLLGEWRHSLPRRSGPGPVTVPPAASAGD